MRGLNYNDRRLRHNHPAPSPRRYYFSSPNRLFPKQQRRRLLFAMSFVCLLSLVHKEFLSFIKNKSYQFTTTTDLLILPLLNDSVAKNKTVHGNVKTSRSTFNDSNNKKTMLLNDDDDDDMSNFVLESMWNCTNKDDDGDESTSLSMTTRSTTGRKKKLIFVHVFKTAGSTMRAFFTGYGRTCSNTGVAIVSQCSGLNNVVQAKKDDEESSIWTNHGSGGGKECILQTFQPRREQDPSWIHTSDNEKTTQQQQHLILEGGPRLTRSFLRATTDVLIGHFPLGVHEHWLVNNNNNSINSVSMTQKEEQDFSYQYVVFFRDPLNKLVSGYLYDNRMRHNLTTEQAAQVLYERIWEKQHVQKLYHDGYSSYLLTPSQKRDIGRLYKGGIKNTTATTIQHNMDLIKSNLLGMRVMIGIVEQMTSSLAILRHLIDGRGELDAAWKALDTTAATFAAAKHPTTTLHHHPPTIISESSSMMSNEQLQQQKQKQNPLLTLNQSRLSTTKIARLLLERDPALLSEHLHYEQDLYDFAMQIHQRQYHATITSKS